VVLSRKLFMYGSQGALDSGILTGWGDTIPYGIVSVKL
jgi:hypothetical protein